jgi:hypothetical protein
LWQHSSFPHCIFSFPSPSSSAPNYTSSRYAGFLASLYSENLSDSSLDNLLRNQTIFWKKFSNDLDLFGPSCEHISHPEDGGLDVFWNESDHRARPEKLEMSLEQLSCVRSAHAQFIDRLMERTYKLPYNQKTRGIVTTAGGQYLGVALVSIRMLRLTGSTLPVELFLSTHEEWDPQICGIIGDYENSLDYQDDDQTPHLRRSIDGIDQSQPQGTYNLQQQREQQPPYPRYEPYPAYTPPQSSFTHNQDQQQGPTDNTFTSMDPVYDPRSAAPPQPTGYPNPGQHYRLTEQGRASEDRNRADYYQAKILRSTTVSSRSIPRAVNAVWR